MGLSVNGNRVTSATCWRSDWGRWYVDVETDKAVALSGTAELVLSDLTLKGTILSGGTFADRARYHIIGGAGWSKEVASKSYANDAGVKVSRVVSDIAQLCGETFDSSGVSGDVGKACAFDKGPAFRILERVAPSAWYVDELGVTHLGKRPRTKITEKLAILSVDRAASIVQIASDKIAQLAPGATVEGIEAIDVVHSITEKATRTTFYGARGATGSRHLRAFRAILDIVDPGRRFRGLYEYRVVAQVGDLLDLQIVRSSTGMPDLRRVPVRPGVPGCSADFVPGSRVIVGFSDESQSGAFVIAGDEVGAAGFLPTVLKIDAVTTVRLGLGVLPIGRTGDPGNPAIAATQTKVLA